MGFKEWLQKFKPVALHLVLALTVILFSAQLIICHVTHALTLLVDSCHMLCNTIALVGCILTVKYETQVPQNISAIKNQEECSLKSKCNGSEEPIKEKIEETPKSNDEKRLRNTFGWTRIEVLMMLIVCVFFASLCFSILVEAVQTLVHIDHMDAMHRPLIVLTMGTISLLLNGFCYLLIGGYTFHQGSFLHVTASGDVVLDSVVTGTSVKQGQRRLSRPRRSAHPIPHRQRQGMMETARDVISCLFVILCSIIVYYIHEDNAKYVDPALAIISALVLLWFTYPYMKESGLILLQTIPDSINIADLNADLLKTFPDILNIHDFHVWQLTTAKVVSTVHIIFLTDRDIAKQCDEVTEFLLEQGITQVTIQPEFSSDVKKMSLTPGRIECLMKCKGKGCVGKSCCLPLKNDDDTPDPTSVVTSSYNKIGECSGSHAEKNNGDSIISKL